MYLFVHVINILEKQYDKIAAIGEFVTLCADAGVDLEGAMEGERREAESSISSLKSDCRFSSFMVAKKKRGR